MITAAAGAAGAVAGAAGVAAGAVGAAAKIALADRPTKSAATKVLAVLPLIIESFTSEKHMGVFPPCAFQNSGVQKTVHADFCGNGANKKQ
ncbi:hypothetical protein GCWU000246_00211 [Jonquetella anthropi E3_33 E1]|nr:hypothetical protein GCWU000246_00211 [Jonquetella anthropi E3_33 E1]